MENGNGNKEVEQVVEKEKKYFRIGDYFSSRRKENNGMYLLELW